jgi:hypothetical protein
VISTISKRQELLCTCSKVVQELAMSTTLQT